MRLKILIIAALSITAAINPELAFAKKKPASSSSHQLTPDQKKRMLADCYKRFPIGPNSYVLRYETHYRKTGWWCYPVY